jgi:hypothetical protein
MGRDSARRKIGVAGGRAAATVVVVLFEAR